MTRLLEVDGVEAGYGAITVLRGVSLHLEAGECLGLFGPNGHGKTTLLNTISGLVPARAGKVRFAGEAVTGARPARIVAAGLVHAAQGNRLFAEMGVAETLELAAFSPRARAGRREALERVYTLFPRLAERRRQRARTLSGGERQMLSIGCAMMCAPRLLMLDEPTLGLSPRLKEELGAAVAAIAATGMPMIVVEQDIEFLLGLAGRLMMIEHGEVAREIDRGASIDHAEIMRLYFGEAVG